MRILVTGGNGFVGRYLVNALSGLSEQPEILIGVRRRPAFQNQIGRIVVFDVTNGDEVQGVIAIEKPSHIFHLAGIAAVAQHDIRTTWAVNLGGSLNLALAVQHSDPSCRLLCCTSAEIYGNSFNSHQPLDESAPLDPINPYGASKAAADILIGQMAKQGLRAIRLRPFNHTGPGQSEAFVVPAFAAQIARIERGEQAPIIRVGNLDIRRDFLDVRDVVNAYVRTLLCFDEIPNGAAINIASGHSFSIRSILHTLLSFSDRKITVVPEPTLFRRSDRAMTTGDAARARTLLDWTPHFDFSHTLKSVLDWYRRK